VKPWERWRSCNVCRCGLYEDERTYCQDCRPVVDRIYAKDGHALRALGPQERAEREARVEAHRRRVEVEGIHEKA
jgi:transcription initiation factor TFIIIB Brf1 subunit/transcription initiation factor TFIIB